MSLLDAVLDRREHINLETYMFVLSMFNQISFLRSHVHMHITHVSWSIKRFNFGDKYFLYYLSQAAWILKVIQGRLGGLSGQQDEVF